MDINFESLNALYMRIKPALTSKKIELHRLGSNYIKEEDIWNHLRETKWGKSIDLSLGEMVNDIFNCENYKIENYVNENISKLQRKVNIDDEEILI